MADPARVVTAPTAVLGRVGPTFSERALAPALLFCLCSAYLLRPMPVWALTFYLGVMPLTLARLWHDHTRNWVELRGWWMPLTAAVALLIVWSALTLLWGEAPGFSRVLKFLWGAICTALFLCAVLFALTDRRNLIDRIATVMIAAGAVNVILTISIFVLRDHLGDRMVGWAETRQPILGSLIINICFAFAFDRFLRAGRGGWRYASASALCVAFVYLTGSRGPLGATLAVALVLLIGRPRGRNWWLAVWGLGLCGLAVLMIPFWVGPSSARDLLSRGVSYRPLIWQFTIARVAERPWFGHGLAAYLNMPASGSFPGAPFPHDLYLSALYFTGVVGLVLLLVVISLVTIGLVRARSTDAPLVRALWANVMIGGLTDLGQVTEGPGTLWLTLWLPVALACALMRDNPGRDGREPMTATTLQRGDGPCRESPIGASR